MVDTYSPPERTSEPSPEFDAGYLHGDRSLDDLIPIPIVAHDTDRLPPPVAPQDPVLDAPAGETLRELLAALERQIGDLETRVCRKVDGVYELAQNLTNAMAVVHQDLASRPCMVDKQSRRPTPGPGCLHVVRAVDEIE